MTTKKAQWSKLFPVFLSFVIMGFVDIIGVATGYVQKDFELTSFVAQFLPMMVLLWFFVLSVPAGILQDKYGKRNMLNIGMLVQAVGLGLPFMHYSFEMMLASFILLGIGNTIIQVSANPLLQDVAPGDKLGSYLSTSQFVKAMISFAGPILTTFLAIQFGDWRLVFAVYGITSILGAVWLSMTPIEESKPDRKPASFASCMGLLKNRFVALMALSIFLIVGTEVAVNTNIANILISKFGLTLETAVLAISVFFAGEMIARLLGAIILNWIKPRVFLLITTLVALLGVVGIFLVPGGSPDSNLIVIEVFGRTLSMTIGAILAFVAIFLIGLGAGNMFPIIFTLSLEELPDRANEISGLLIMAVSGGAVIPLVMGLVSTTVGPIASISVVGACMLYVLGVAFYVRKRQ